MDIPSKSSSETDFELGTSPTAGPGGGSNTLVPPSNHHLKVLVNCARAASSTLAVGPHGRRPESSLDLLRGPSNPPMHGKRARLTVVRTPKTEQLLTMDILVLATMKNAAKCDT